MCVMFPQVAVQLSTNVAPAKGSQTASLRRGPVIIHRISDVVKPADVCLDVDDSGKSDGSQFKPLIKSSDQEVLSKIKRKTMPGADDNGNGEETGAKLLWSLIYIAAKWNGRLKCSAGISDPRGPEAAIVSLLLGDEGKDGGAQRDTLAFPSVLPSPRKSSAEEGVPSEEEDTGSSSLEAVQSLLLRGQREEAVSSALDCKNYALALLVASMCDPDCYRATARRFADEALMKGSPLHTTALLFSGQLQPPKNDMLDRSGSSASFWRDSSQKLKQTWRFHLATILSNRTLGWERIVMSLGDRLLHIGHVPAAHFCYMVCGLSITPAWHPSARLVLVGCDHIDEMNTSLQSREGTESFERTEAFEWAKRRGNPHAAVSVLQPFKLTYAKLLADYGFEEQALQYIETIRQCAGLDAIEPATASPKGRKAPPSAQSALIITEEFKNDLFVFEDRICESLGVTPSWKSVDSPKKNSVSRAFENVSSALWGKKTSKGGTTLEAEKIQEAPASPVPSVPRGPVPEQEATPPIAPAASSPLVNEIKALPTPESKQQPYAEQTGQENDASASFISAKTNLMDVTTASLQTAVEAEPSRDTGRGEDSRESGTPASMLPVDGEHIPEAKEAVASNFLLAKEEQKGDQSSSAPSSTNAAKVDRGKPKQAAPASEGKKSGWRSWINKKLNPDATTADVGDEMQAYYDEKLKRWIFPGDDPAEVAKPLPPPPKTPMQQEAPKEETKTADLDPLAALMAPPPVTRSVKKGPAMTPGSMAAGPPGMTGMATGSHLPPPIQGGPPTRGMAASAPAGLPSTQLKDPFAAARMATPQGGKSSTASQPPPQFAVFQPKADQKKEEQ